MIAFASASLLITAIAFVAMLFSFRSGFLQYINDHRYQSLEQLSQVMSQQVSSPEDWKSLSGSRREWGRLIGFVLQSKTTLLTVPKKSSNHRRPPHEPPPGVHGPNGSYAPPHRPPRSRPRQGPFSLLDAQQRLIFGRMDSVQSMWTLPIQVEDRLVGYVAMNKLDNFNSNADKVFVAEQTRYFIGIALVASIVALLIAFFLARWMVVPIELLDKAMSALMKRDYQAKVTYSSSDEMGRLMTSFNQLASSLGEYDQTQQKWIADISHELRTPLSTLRGEVEAMQEGVRDMTPQRLDSLHEEVLRLQRIVDDLHQLSLSDAGAMRYIYDKVSMTAIIQQCIAHSDVVLSQHNLTHSIVVTGDEKNIYGDADRLNQLFSNLLQNTIRYTNSGGQLRIRLHFDDSQSVRIFWDDSEPGVLPSSLGKLFDRLYREEQSRNREKGGSGLGLSICRSIVEAHQGNVQARASDLGGVMIELSFPVINK